MIIIFQCLLHLLPFHMQLESPSALAHIVCMSMCVRVCVVRQICSFFAHGAGKTIAVGLRISPIPVLSYSEPLIEF